MGEVKEPGAQRADARRNRTRVLEAAQVAFASQGIQVPLDEIARLAGVGAGTVYRHFPTKEALFEAVILHRMQHLATRAWDAAAADGDAGALFFDFVGSMVRDSAAKRDLLDALAGIGVGVTANMRDVNRELRAAITALMHRAQAAGAVRGDVDVDHVMSLLHGVFTAARTAGTTDDARIDTLLAVVCDGLRAEAARPRRG